MSVPLDFIALRSLPSDVRRDFERFLDGQTRPIVEGDSEPYGWAYRWDFRQWMSLQRITDPQQAKRIYQFIWD